MAHSTSVSPPTPESQQQHYARPSLTADIVLFTFAEGMLQLLLIQRAREPFAGSWALPGGFIDIDEALEVAARRELYEETGVKDIYVEQLHTFGTPDRDPRGRVITVAYLALAGADIMSKTRAGDDASEATWYAISNLPPLAFDHHEIIQVAFRRLQTRVESTSLGFLLLPAFFTLSDVQQMYEAILQEKLDKRNFRRKTQSLGIIEDTGLKRHGDHRPATLYRYVGREK
ncbi:MAG: NUDIX hydrolase [Chloroflexi bacterium]|nr:NUDIX hydrolase [Chloroflexota bacterium]